MARSALPGSLMVMRRPVNWYGGGELGVQGAIAGVARRHHHNHARADKLVHLDAQRALAARKPFGRELVAHAHVDAVDAHEFVTGGILLAHVRQSTHHPAHPCVAVSASAEHL